MELKQDLYIIPLLNGNLVYSPLRRGLFWAGDEACQIIESYLSGDIRILEQDNNPVVKYIRQLEEMTATTPQQASENFSKRGLVVIPSQTCNLACAYCYAHQAHTKEYIDKPILANAYDYILKSNNEEKHFSFIGGGEPMMTWDLLKWSFEYISSRKSNNDKVFFNITTNATLFNDDILLTIKKYGVRINVSFDILKDVQDRQRPFQYDNRSSFDIVHKNIQILDENNISYGIRSTITMKNVSLMPEMVQFVANNYSNLRSLHFEPVTDNIQEGYYQEYINCFFQGREIAKNHNIDLYNSMTRSVFNITDRFCNGELCLTPTGDIVACHRISSIKDEHFSRFLYGKVTNTSVDISLDKYQKFLKFAQEKRENCKQCFAYWHCAGICPMERASLNDKQLTTKCEFIREIIKRTLLEYLRK